MTVDLNGEVQVLVPKRISQSVIEEFVLRNIDWIEKQQQRQALRREEVIKKNPPKKFVAGDRFRFFGVDRELIFEPSDKSKLHFEIVESYLVAHVPKSLHELGGEAGGVSGGVSGGASGLQAERASRLREALAKFAESEARRHLTERLNYWSKQMQLPFAGSSFRKQKTRWGSCSTAGHISLNWKLVFAPEDVIDYVIIHELAHLVHANHSSQFWNLVEKYDPEARQHRRWLRDHQHETLIFD